LFAVINTRCSSVSGVRCALCSMQWPWPWPSPTKHKVPLKWNWLKSPWLLAAGCPAPGAPLPPPPPPSHFPLPTPPSESLLAPRRSRPRFAPPHKLECYRLALGACSPILVLVPPDMYEGNFAKKIGSAGFSPPPGGPRSWVPYCYARRGCLARAVGPSGGPCHPPARPR
jgi:hypothetical protein